MDSTRQIPVFREFNDFCALVGFRLLQGAFVHSCPCCGGPVIRDWLHEAVQLNLAPHQNGILGSFLHLPTVWMHVFSFASAVIHISLFVMVWIKYIKYKLGELLEPDGIQMDLRLFLILHRFWSLFNFLLHLCFCAYYSNFTTHFVHHAVQ